MPITPFDYDNMCRRVAANRRDGAKADIQAAEACSDESALHRQIMDYCDSQWPKWPYIRARMDKRATIGAGVHDITIFMPGRVLCIECKTKAGKLSHEQQCWDTLMRMVGHPVHVVRSWADFWAILFPK